MAFPSVQVAVITGATSGIGAAFAHELAKRGSQLVLISRNFDKLTAIQNELAAYPHSTVEVLAADLSTSQGIDAAVSRIGALPRLDLLVNNAGFGHAGCFVDIEIASHEEMVNLHVVATMRLTHAALPKMKTQQAGAVINVSSVSAFIPSLSGVSYTATKAYGVNFSLALSAELEGTGVRVQALCPGLTHTYFHQRSGFDLVSHAPAFLWNTSEFVVQRSLQCLNKNQPLCIPGLLNRSLIRLSHWPPILRFALYRKRKMGSHQKD